MSLRPTLLAVSVCLAGLGGALVGAALAQDKGPHDKAIKARQATMLLNDYYLGMLFDMVKGKRDYDAELATEAANNLAALVGLGQSTLWPEGSDKASPGAPTRAMAEIWTTYPAITEKAEALAPAVAELVPVAGDGVDALKGAVGDVGAACKGCHDDFRAEERG